MSIYSFTLDLHVQELNFQMHYFLNLEEKHFWDYPDNLENGLIWALLKVIYLGVDRHRHGNMMRIIFAVITSLYQQSGDDVCLKKIIMSIPYDLERL